MNTLRGKIALSKQSAMHFLKTLVTITLATSAATIRSPAETAGLFTLDSAMKDFPLGAARVFYWKLLKIFGNIVVDRPILVHTNTPKVILDFTSKNSKLGYAVPIGLIDSKRSWSLDCCTV